MAEKKETKEVKEVKETKAEAAKETKETKTEAAKDSKKAEKAKETKAEAAKETKTEEIKAEEEKKLKESTERNRREKAERREAKAARKAANIVEEKKRRPNNALIAVLIFGVLVGMFAFIWGYNYYKKAASIEKYLKDQGMAEMYSSFAIDEYTTAKLKAEGNTVKMVLNIAEDAPEEAVEAYKGDDGKEQLDQMASYFLTTWKPETRGFTGDCKIVVKKGDEKINSTKMTYRQAKRFVKEAEKKAQEEQEQGDGGADTDSDAEADTGAETDAGTDTGAEE